jgi:hypothetical protein
VTDRKRTRLCVLTLATVASVAFAAYAPPTEGQSGARPQYTAEGLLRLPVGFESWVFVGSNLGMAYRRELPLTDAREAARSDQAQLFHNVYINPEAYAHFAATKEFPDPTILVMEIFIAADKQQQLVLSTGVFNGERVGLEVAVKDTRRPPVQPAPPPSPWNYYIFMDPNDKPPALQTAVKPDPSGVCQACHKRHASKDNVWVQFYPTLRKLSP